MKSIFLAAVSAILLSGCNNLGTPQGAAESAMDALMHANLKDFRGALSGNALATYGETVESMLKLRTELAKTGVELGKLEQLDQKNEDGMTYSQTYSLEVLGNYPQTVVKTLTVVCATRTALNCGAAPSSVGANPFNNCYSTTCTVDEIR